MRKETPVERNETVEITVNGKKKTAAVGSRLSEILKMPLPCGGLGKCGKCEVLVDGKKERACRFRVLAPCAVITPQPSGDKVEFGEFLYGIVGRHWLVVDESVALPPTSIAK